jgi:hypothetical protein
MLILYITKPSVLYDYEKNEFRQFGTTNGKTLLPIYVIGILLAIIFYVFFYYLSISTKNQISSKIQNDMNDINSVNNNLVKTNNFNNDYQYYINHVNQQQQNQIQQLQTQMNQILQQQLITSQSLINKQLTNNQISTSQINTNQINTNQNLLSSVLPNNLNI